LISSKHCPEERNKCGKNSSVIDSAALVTALLDERERCTSNCAGCPVAWLYNCSRTLLALHLNESASEAHLFKHSDRECVIILAEMCRARFGFLNARCPLTAAIIGEIESILWHFYMGAPLILCECVDCFSYFPRQVTSGQLHQDWYFTQKKNYFRPMFYVINLHQLLSFFVRRSRKVFSVCCMLIAALVLTAVTNSSFV
jgi:hypothetical protein